MRLTIRRIGNSLGVIVPKTALDAWGVGEGDTLELTARGIAPPPAQPAGHGALDEHKRKLAAAVATRFPANAIRAHSLANLHRWRKAGAWVTAYDEWADILRSGDDGSLFAAMLGRDERSNRLRQSPPYVGLLPRDEVAKLNEEAAA
jgi:antitoxin component of MazEF toxin-antitoxin module